MRLKQAFGDVEAIFVHRHRRFHQPRISDGWNLARHVASLARQAHSRQAVGARYAPRMIYFEDLEVGVEAYYGSYEVTREEVLEFAGKYDPQPFHLDDEAASRTHFGRIAASGWHTGAMAMAVIARKVVGEDQAGLGSPGLMSCAG